MALPEDQLPEEENDFFDYAGDILAAPFRGVEGAVQGAYNLADYLAFDVLPDYDTRFLGTSKTMAGGLVEGVAQFATGFVPLFGAAGRIGALAKAGTAAKAVTAGAITDFTFFNGQEARLSNLIQQYPELQNPVTEFLAHDADEGEIEGRLKNVLEGLGLEAVAGVFISGLKGIKKVRDVRNNGGTPEEAAAAVDEVLQGGRVCVEDEAQIAARREREETDELYRMVGGDPEDIPEVDLRTINWDEVDIEEAVDVAPRVPREELEAIEAGGKLVDEIETNTAIVKTYEMPGGSTKTVMVDKANPDRVFDFSPTTAGDLDVRFTGPKKAGIAQEFKEKTLIEGVGQRMQTDNPVTAREALQELVDKTGGRLGQYQPVIDRLLALGKGTGIDAKLETRAAASELPTTKKGSFYESGKRRIVLDGDSSSFQQNPVYELLHESTHAVTVDNVNKYFDANAFNAIDINDIGARAAAIDEVLKKRLPKPIAEMFRMFKKADNMRDEIIAKSDLKTVAGEADTYWIKNPAEFMSMTFSDPIVQRALKGIEYDPKMSLWEKIVDTVKRLLGKGVTNDLADSIVTRVGEIAQMRLPKRRGRGVVDFAPSFDPKKPNEFLQAVPEKFRGYAEALLEGGTPRLPQFALETGDDVIVLKELLESYYKENPDKITVEGAVTEIGEEVEKQLMLQKGKDAATKVAEARIVNQSLRDQGSAVIQNLQDSIKKYEVAGGGDKAIAEIKNSFQQLLSIGDVYRQLGRESGLLLGSRRENFRSRKIGISESDYEIDGIRKEFVNASGSDPDKMVKIISETIDPNDPQATFDKLFKISKKAQGKSMLDMPTEYWMNAILSGPKTQVVNAMGNSLTQIWSSIEAVFGGIASGNMDVVRAVMASWSDKEMYKEAGKFAKKAFKQSDNVLDPNARSFSDRPEVAITGKRISEALPGQGLSAKQEAGLDWFANNVIRIPSRLLMTTDEFFKQLAYRRAARLKAAMSGIQQGIDNPKQLAAHINNTLEGVITEGGRMGSKEGLAREANEIAVQKGITDTTEKNNFILDYVEQNFDGDKSALIQYAQDEARYLTFTKELEEGIGASLQSFTNKHPGFRFILPFVRTPTNILTFALERTPLVATPLMKQEFSILRKEIASEDPIIKAQARGKVVTAGLVVLGLVEAISDGENSITGGGPKNEKEKKALQEAGWQPYSIKIGDTYYSYQRLDPLATPLGIIADLVETGRDISALESKDNEKLLEHAYQSMIISLTRNITNKSYLTGIQNFTDALSDPERFAAKFSRNFASSFVPNILSQMADSDEQVLRETRGVMDAVKRKIGLRGSLDAKRNILGEEIMTETLLASPFQAANPIAISTKKDDPILQAMAELKHGFRNPISNLGGDIDLLDYEKESGQSAYDRWLELVSQVKVRGDTLRQRLNRLIKSRDFKNTSPLSEPGLESPRIQMITSVIREFRNEARKQMLKEFPDLDRQYSTLALAKTRLKTGVSREDVLELLTQ